MPKPPVAAVMMMEPKPDEPDNGEVRFKSPEGFDTEGKEKGDTVEAVAELEIEDGGKLCLKKLNGIELQGYKKPEPQNFADAVAGENDNG